MGIEPWPQRWDARVLPLCHRGPSVTLASIELKIKNICLYLLGQIIYLAEQKQMIFIGSPRLSSLNELEEKNMHLSDIPLYDVTRELVLLNQQRIAEIEIR